MRSTHEAIAGSSVERRQGHCKSGTSLRYRIIILQGEILCCYINHQLSSARFEGYIVYHHNTLQHISLGSLTSRTPHQPTIMSSSCTDVLTRKPQNIAISTNPQHDLNVVTTEIPEPGPKECLVHVRATGICGSDVHFWKEGKIGDSVITQDCGLGHESAGIVIKTGSDVEGLKIGMFILKGGIG